MDTEVMIMFAVETVILIATLVVAGISLFKNYKGKQSLTIEEVMQLSQQFFNYANDAYKTISKFSDIYPGNFDSKAEYKSVLITRIIEDLDKLSKSDTAGVINSALYDKLSYAAKVSLVSNITDKIPSFQAISNNTESTGDGSAKDTSGDEADADSENDTVDIGEHLI